MMMRAVRGVALALSLSAIPTVVNAAGMPGTMGADASMDGRTVVVPVTAGPYKLTLMIGPMEPMYTEAQARRQHPRAGEVMLRGAMAMGGMGMSMPNRHLELHVLDRRTMRVVTNAMVSITYQPVAPMGAMAIRPQTVPAALMVGIGMGMGDAHYGNNVYMPRGEYHVMARVNDAHATYDVRLM